MKRLNLIRQCATGEIAGAEYDALCRAFPWLKINVEAERAAAHSSGADTPAYTSSGKSKYKSRRKSK